MNNDFEFTVKPVVSSDRNMLLPVIMLGTVAFFSYSFAGGANVTTKGLNYSSPSVYTTPTKGIIMEKKKYKPTRERLLKARAARLAVPNRGSDEEYRRAILEETEELKEVRRRAKVVSVV